MNCTYYEEKLNNVIVKCPIEFGVEILVYNLLDYTMDSSSLALIDINSIWGKKDKRLEVNGVVPDIAVLSNDFIFGTNCGVPYGFIEAKSTSNKLYKTKQIIKEKGGTKHFIYTNGLTWMYFQNGVMKWEITIACLDEHDCKFITEPKTVSVDSDRFDLLIDKLRKINWSG